MLRKFVCAAFALVICVGILLAEEVTGKLTKVDSGKGMISLKVGEKDKNFKVGADTKIVDGEGKDLKEGLKAAGFKEGAEVVVTYEKEGKKVTVKEIKLKK